MKIFIKNSSIILYLLLISGILGYGIIIYYTNKLSEKWRKILIILRTTTLILLLFLLSEPFTGIFKSTREEECILTLFDISGSMGIKDKNKRSRFERGMEILRKIKKRIKNRILVFDTDIKEVEDIKKVSLSGNNTDIRKVFNRLKYMTGEEVRGILFISDGIQSIYGNPLNEIKNFAEKKIPVYTFDFFDNEEIIDLSLEDVKSPSEAGINTPIPVELRIRRYGKNINPCKLQVFVNDKLRKEERLFFKRSDILNKIIKLKIQKSGINRIKIKIPALKKESIRENNEKVVYIRGIKEKLKLLLIYGKPSWEFKFIKRALERDPYIIVTDIVKTSYRELTKLERINLLNFDIIFIGGIASYELPAKFKNQLLEFARRKAGGVIFHIGEISLSEAEYKNSTLKDLFPVDWNKTGGMIKRHIHFNLTPDGLNLYRRFTDIDNIKKLIKYLPPVVKFNLITGVKKNAIILGNAKENGEYILMAVGRYKRIRTGLINFYPTWHWGFEEDVKNSFFTLFWSGFIKSFLSLERKPVYVVVDKATVNRNEPVNIKIINSLKYDVDLEIIKDGKKIIHQLIKRGDFTDNLYSINFRPYKSGEYRINISCKGTAIKDSTYFVVETPSEEYYNLIPDKNLLKKIAELTGGKFIKKDKIKEIKLKKIKTKKIGRYEERPLLSIWWYPVLIILLASIEWFIRRKQGII